MKNLFFFILMLTFITNSFGQKNIKQVVSEKFPGVFEIKAANLVLIVDANTGARITSAKYGDFEFLVPKNDEKIAFGSTFWPSPYMTNWPPPKDYDQTAWEVKELGNGLLLSGPVLKNLGLQFKKKIEFQSSDSSFVFEYTIFNKTDSVVWVAPWEITRLPKGGEFIAPALSSQFNTQKSLELVENGFYSGLFRCVVPESYQGKSQKISLDANEGWEVYILKEHIFLKLFENIEKEKFAKKSADAELYIDDDSNYVEVESQGAFVSIPPGSSIVYKTKWLLLTIPKNDQPVFEHILKITSHYKLN